MNTPCKNCVFAIYDGVTQTDCRFKMLDIFEQSGATLIAAYDQDAEFFVIEDRLCPMARGIHWYREHKGNETEQLKKELTYNYNVILTLPDTKEKLADSIEKLLGCESQPAVITIIRTPDSKLSKDEVKGVLGNYKIPQWKLMNVVENKSAREILKGIIQLTKNNVYILVEDHSSLPDRLLDKINYFGIYCVQRFGGIFGNGIFAVYRNEYLRAYYLDDPKIGVLEKMSEEPELYSVIPLEEVINYEGHINSISL